MNAPVFEKGYPSYEAVNDQPLSAPIQRLGQGTSTYEMDAVKFTTHPITGYKGDGLKPFIDLIKKDYDKAGIYIINIRTYYNSGYNHATDKYEGREEFGIEVEHL